MEEHGETYKKWKTIKVEQLNRSKRITMIMQDDEMGSVKKHRRSRSNSIVDDRLEISHNHQLQKQKTKIHSDQVSRRRSISPKEPSKENSVAS